MAGNDGAQDPVPSGTTNTIQRHTALLASRRAGRPRATSLRIQPRPIKANQYNSHLLEIPKPACTKKPAPCGFPTKQISQTLTIDQKTSHPHYRLLGHLTKISRRIHLLQRELPARYPLIPLLFTDRVWLMRFSEADRAVLVFI